MSIHNEQSPMDSRATFDYLQQHIDAQQEHAAIRMNTMLDSLWVLCGGVWAPDTFKKAPPLTRTILMRTETSGQTALCLIVHDRNSGYTVEVTNPPLSPSDGVSVPREPEGRLHDATLVGRSIFARDEAEILLGSLERSPSILPDGNFRSFAEQVLRT